MNIDDLTLGQIKQLQGVLGGTQEKSSGLYNRYIGKYVICRSRNEGLNAGKVVAADDTGVILEDARRLWYHKPANKNLSWYEGVALDGINKDSKIGAPVEKIIAEDYSLTVCTEKAEVSIRNEASHEQN
jgi:hypothetical protein